MWVNSDDSSTWRYKKRSTVLGAWHMIKKSMYAEYLEWWDKTHEK
jgi:hypothetical protein